MEPSENEAAAHWFEPVAAHLGRAYLRYSFTMGTTQEVEFLVRRLGLCAGRRVLDVGCGPGRHAWALAERGMIVHGVDISATFVDIACDGAPEGATFERLDARTMRFDAEFDSVICLCQGAFGLMTATGDDDVVFANMARALKPGGLLALSAFNAYFAVRYHDAATFDAATGVSHEHTEVRNESGEPKTVDLWTGCYTPRELRLLAAANGLLVEELSSVEPGDYATRPPTTETPELLLIARRR